MKNVMETKFLLLFCSLAENSFSFHYNYKYVFVTKEFQHSIKSLFFSLMMIKCQLSCDQLRKASNCKWKRKHIQLNVVHNSHVITFFQVIPEVSFWFFLFENLDFFFSFSLLAVVAHVTDDNHFFFFFHAIYQLSTENWRVRMNTFLRESQRVESKLLWIFLQLLFPWQKPKPLLKVPNTLWFGNSIW